MRLSPLAQEDFDAEQSALVEQVVGRGASAPPPLLVWAHHAPLARWVEGLGAYCRNDSLLTSRLRGLTMMVAAQAARSPYVWYAHLDELVGEGMAAESLERLACGEDPRFDDPDEQLAWEFCDQALNAHAVSDATFAAALARFGEKALFDLLGCLGSFTTSALAMNTFRVPILGDDPDRHDPFPDPAGRDRTTSAGPDR